MGVDVTFPNFAGEYTAGTIITLRVQWSDAKDATGSDVDFEIIRTLSPFTHSVACVIRPVVDPRGKPYFLKMYDRRFSNQLRDDPGWQSSGEHTPQREAAYQRYLVDTDHPKFGFLDLEHDAMSDEDKAAHASAFYPPPSEESDEEDADPILDGVQASNTEEVHSIAGPIAANAWSRRRSKYVGPWSGITRFEILAARMSKLTYESERETYRELQEWGKTGSLAPRLFGVVEYSSPVGMMQGLLLEHIHNAITLRHYLHAAAPCGHLSARVAEVCNMAWNALGDLTKDTPFYTTDIRHDDILVQLEDEWQIPDTLLERQYLPLQAYMWNEPPTLAVETAAILQAPPPPRCVVVDFESVSRRSADENDFEWAMNRAHDEEHGLLWFHPRSDLIGALEEECKVHGTSCWSDLSLRKQETLWTRPVKKRFPMPTLSRRERRMYEDTIGYGFGFYHNREMWYHLLPPPRGGRTEPIETDDEDSEEESESEESEEEAEEDGDIAGANEASGEEALATEDLADHGMMTQASVEA